MVLSGRWSQSTVQFLNAFGNRQKSRAYLFHAHTLESWGIFWLNKFLKPSEETCWYDDALRCIYVLHVSGVNSLGFRGCPPQGRAPYTELHDVQWLQPLSILWRKEDFTLTAAKFTFRRKDNTSLLSQMVLSGVTTFNKHRLSLCFSANTKIFVYIWEVFTYCSFLDFSLIEKQEQQQKANQGEGCKCIPETCLKLLHLWIRFSEINTLIQFSLALPKQIFREESGARTAADFSCLQITAAELAEVSILGKRSSVAFQLVKTQHIQEFHILGGMINLQFPLSDVAFALSKGLFSFFWVWFEWDQDQAPLAWIIATVVAQGLVWAGKVIIRKVGFSQKCPEDFQCQSYPATATAIERWIQPRKQHSSWILSNVLCWASIYTWKMLSKIFTFKYF